MTIDEGQDDVYGIVRKELPCPADYNRPPESPSDHRQWGGNVARKKDD